MLSFFRRITKSRLGVIVTLGILAVIALAFGLSDISNVAPTGAAGTTVVEVGDGAVTDTELQQRTRLALDAVRQQQPTIDIDAFIAQGGLESVIDRTVNGMALDLFAQASGMVASKALIDGQIASIPAFQGFDGKFSQANFERALATQRISQADLRDDIRRELYAQWLLAPTQGASQVPAQLATPYASLLLEKRAGQIALVPASTAGIAAPSAEILAKFYASNRARYNVPQRRVLRYAVVSPEQFGGTVQVSDAEIAEAYRAAGDRYAPSATRTLQQVIVADQAAANRIAQAVRGGTSIEAAARAAGLEATTLTNVAKPDLAGRSAPAVADAAFAANDGSVAGPVRSPFGWHVIRVAGVAQSAGRPLASVRDELVTEIRRSKALEALTAVQETLDTGINDGATFDELMSDTKLQAQRTAPVIASGINPDAPDRRPDPRFARLFEAGFAAEQGDAPQLVQLGEDGTFGVVGVERIIAAAPRPLAQIRDQVVADWQRDQAKQAARRQALAVIQNVNRGTALPQAIRAAGVNGPEVQSINVSRADLAARREQLPPPVALMFSMKQGTAKLLEAPNGEGWFIVSVTGIERGDAKGNTNAINATRQGLGSVIGREYVQQFTAAARATVGVKRDDAAVARLRNSLTGAGE
ncbi:peptidylprolyl isomerase [Sphingomonas qomolangmaensis]|uniref:Parvulin-like PPIase n=1 Tax=Sphingomonas qomolangmaensis TaxID=2918765 RepID=A0ABY5LCY7_9SPHN|nr:peptidylprolyl isomerase [Sphingomonas qomolangmaensis]UUL83579.1 SurA N-terminal domain-containing protein [Sphingomonas qomolangmaensis]